MQLVQELSAVAQFSALLLRFWHTLILSGTFLRRMGSLPSYGAGVGCPVHLADSYRAENPTLP
jgi:hypothetical protein